MNTAADDADADADDEDDDEEDGGVSEKRFNTYASVWKRSNK